MFASLGHNLGNLFDFSGRDSRAQFWPWAIFLFILSLIAQMAVFVPVMTDWMVRIQRYVIEHPEGPPVGKPGMVEFPPEMLPDFSGMYVPMMIIKAAWILLMAASVLRRLHDCDRSLLWALAYLPFAAIGAIFGRSAYSAMTSGNAPGPLYSLLMVNNLLGFLVIVLLIILLASRGTPGPNRFGPEPLVSA
ncbi:MAG TPA: DUF805 domain-containing protein [Allosphingosinicella sp.]|jgi:uncharacterized membrane protein YhaH (DUF805 family)